MLLSGSREIVIATRNRGKTKEFSQLFAKVGLQVRDLNDFAYLPEVLEDGLTFAENAEKKAGTIARSLRLTVIADDSGLCVDALDGAPSVFSARYAGASATDEMNNAKLLAELGKRVGEGQLHGSKGVRLLSAAQFVCVLAMHDPVKEMTLYSEGKCRGYIVDKPQGEGGFGYDPLFYLPEYEKTMAELTPEEKNQISHRGKALRKMLDLLNVQSSR